MQQPQVVEKQKTRNIYQPERNEALIYRYYFHCEINRMRYDDAMHQLELEFCITSCTITKLIASDESLIDELIISAPSIKQLKEKFPWFDWTKQSIKRA